MPFLPVDNVNTCTTLVAGSPLTVASVVMSVTPGTGQNFPSGSFLARLGSLQVHDSELVFCTPAGADTFAIQRGQNGTTAEAWPVGTVVQCMLPLSDDATAESVSSLMALVGGFAPMQPTLKPSASAVVLATSGTIPTAGVAVSRVNPAGAVTAVILQQGTQDGQLLLVENQSASSVTMAASGTSNVADGTSDTIAATTCAIYEWNATTALWYRIKAA